MDKIYEPNQSSDYLPAIPMLPRLRNNFMIVTVPFSLIRMQKPTAAMSDKAINKIMYPENRYTKSKCLGHPWSCDTSGKENEKQEHNKIPAEAYQWSMLGTGGTEARKVQG